MAGIGRSLAAGKLVVLHDAFKAAFAEKVHRALDRFEGWTLYEKYVDGFHYHHHNLYDKRLFPPALAFCDAVFGAPSSRELMARLSRTDCTAETALGASLYLPGDHSTPHDDTGASRRVAFIWHLTRGWRPDWGGELYWIPDARLHPPSFNTLYLFNVSRETFHFVVPVSPYARGKRLTVNGWWTGNARNTFYKGRGPAAGRALDLAGKVLAF